MHAANYKSIHHPKQEAFTGLIQSLQLDNREVWLVIYVLTSVSTVPAIHKGFVYLITIHVFFFTVCVSPRGVTRFHVNSCLGLRGLNGSHLALVYH